ncbi:hypothetical protein BpHYR1_050511, partial [Brachionus plicatilis]
QINYLNICRSRLLKDQQLLETKFLLIVVTSIRRNTKSFDDPTFFYLSTIRLNCFDHLHLAEWITVVTISKSIPQPFLLQSSVTDGNFTDHWHFTFNSINRCHLNLNLAFQNFYKSLPA